MRSILRWNRLTKDHSRSSTIVLEPGLGEHGGEAIDDLGESPRARCRLRAVAADRARPRPAGGHVARARRANAAVGEERVLVVVVGVGVGKKKGCVFVVMAISWLPVGRAHRGLHGDRPPGTEPVCTPPPASPARGRSAAEDGGRKLFCFSRCKAGPFGRRRKIVSGRHCGPGPSLADRRSGRPRARLL